MFSIVIPLYNKELSIKNTILSVLNQTYQIFEIVIINDGSTDGSVDVVNTIDDKRIRLIHQENQGVSAARNHGIKEANYNWIAFLDGDDIWDKNHLLEITNMMKKFPNEKIYVTSFEYSDKREMYKHERENNIFRIENYFKEAIEENLIWTSIVVVERNCFTLIGGFNVTLNRGEDLDMWARLASKFNIIKSSIVTAVYKVDAENRATLSRNVKNRHIYTVDLSLIDNIDEKKYYKYQILSRMYEYFRVGYYKSFLMLKNKHFEISYFEIFFYFLMCLMKGIKRKIFGTKKIY